MTNLSRWDPFGEMLSLRDAMSQLLEESYVGPRAHSGGALSMPLNVSETEDAFHVEAALPGVKPEDIDITFQNNTLLITGETRQERQSGDKQPNYHMMERRYGRFSRAISLPTAVNPDKVQATLDNGILRLVIPKAESAKSRKIAISSSSQNQSIDVTPQGGQQQAEDKQSVPKD